MGVRRADGCRSAAGPPARLARRPRVCVCATTQEQHAGMSLRMSQMSINIHRARLTPPSKIHRTFHQGDGAPCPAAHGRRDRVAPRGPNIPSEGNRRSHFCADAPSSRHTSLQQSAGYTPIAASLMHNAPLIARPHRRSYTAVLPPSPARCAALSRRSHRLADSEARWTLTTP